MAKPEGQKILAENRRARHEYHFLETLEVGIVLTGTEVKSVRAGQVQLRDAYAAVESGELWLRNAHVSPYEQGNRWNRDPTSVRKLLAHRREIDKLHAAIREKGLTLVPVKMYLKDGKIKLEIAVAKGKQLHDKRESERKREADNEARDAIARSRRM